MAAEWIDETFPDAAPGSIDVAIFENRDLPDMADRADGMHQITSMTDKADIAAVVGVDGTPVTAQSKAENLFLTNPEIKVVLSYNTDTASGVSAYATALNSQIEDTSKFATFACDFSELAVQLLQGSKTDDSVVRGVVRMGTTFGAIIDDVYKYAMEALTTEDYDPISYAELYKITPENIEGMLQ
jgi:ABC-type sugar transport system substrate-binding protein